jgi:hypothetical protein
MTSNAEERLMRCPKGHILATIRNANDVLYMKLLAHQPLALPCGTSYNDWFDDILQERSRSIKPLKD